MLSHVGHADVHYFLRYVCPKRAVELIPAGEHDAVVAVGLLPNNRVMSTVHPRGYQQPTKPLIQFFGQPGVAVVKVIG